MKAPRQRRTVPVSPSRLARPKKLSVDLPTPLYVEAQAVMRERQINTSHFVREAVEQYLQTIRENKLEKELREGYLANAGLDQQICANFGFSDAEHVKSSIRQT